MEPSDSNTRGPRRWIKIGCVGVVVVVVIFAAWTAVVFGSAWLSTRNEEVERASLEVGIEASLRPGSSAVTPESVLRVELHLTVGEFEIRAGRPGGSIRVVGEFDHRSYALEESFEVGPPGAGTYRIRFHETSWVGDGGLRVLFGGHRPELLVYLPPDVPIELVGRFSKGGTEVRLGGLWLTSIDIEIAQGGGHVGVDEPLVAPVDTFRIHARQGGLSTRRLGNASPRSLEVDTAMGGSTIDLRGAWLQDSEVSVRQFVGGGNLILPRNVDVDGYDMPARLRLPHDPELPRAQMRLSVSQSVGAFQVD